MRIVCTAQSFGFGPASTLVSIASQLGGRCTLIFIGQGTALERARASSHLFSDLIDQTFDESLLQDLNPDAVLGVLEPGAILAAHRQDIPSFHVDVLSWFWGYEKKLPTPQYVADTAAEWAAMPQEQLAIAWTKVDIHFAMMMAHYWASKTFVQGSSEWQQLSGAMTDSKVVGAIVANREDQPSTRKGRPIISFSGALSPINTDKSLALYCEVVSRLIRATPLLESVTICGHQQACEYMRELGHGAAYLSHSEFQSEMSQATFALAPAGLTTTIEAASLQTPLGFLPEWNGSHSSGADYLSSLPETYPSAFIAEVMNVSRTLEPSQLEDLYLRLLAEDSDFTILADAFSEMCRKLSESGGAYAVRQRDSIDVVFGSLDGAGLVADTILNAL